MARSGKLWCVAAGPPCETWPAARFAKDEGRRNLRPLCRGSLPWGLQGLNRKEMWQLDASKKLLQAAIEIAFSVSRAGVIKHPEFPAWYASKDRPSIWDFAVVTRLRELDDVSTFGFDQCIVGQDALKPTTLLLFCLLRIATLLEKFAILASATIPNFAISQLECGTLRVLQEQASNRKQESGTQHPSSSIRQCYAKSLLQESPRP